jgi:hypothetical protein
MPRYFLHIHDGFLAIDHEGVELPDADAARYHAVKGLRDIIATQVLAGKVPRYEYIVIADESGEDVGKITFDDAIEILHQRTS